MATKKLEKSTDERLVEATALGFNHILALNDKQTEKKIFRAAVGHGCHDAGPILITNQTIGHFS